MFGIRRQLKTMLSTKFDASKFGATGVGSPAWIRTTIHGSKGRSPAIRRSGKEGGGFFRRPQRTTSAPRMGIVHTLSMRKTSILLISASAFFLAACASEPAVDKAAITKSVKDVEAAILKSVTTKDAKAGASNYATEPSFLSPGSAPAESPRGLE